LPGFNHEHTGPNATDFMAAFPGGSMVTVQGLGNPGSLLGWGDWSWFASGVPGAFNAVHMALIPKGPHRGKVIVWNTYPVVIQPGPSFSSTAWWYCQGWSIVDPRPNAPAPRFRNFLLPIGQWFGSRTSGHHLAVPLDTDPNVTLAPTVTTFYYEVSGIFCSGHAWTHEGDLVVAGGDTFRFGSTVGIGRDNGAKLLFMLDMNRPSHVDSPMMNAALYPGEVGHWRQPADQLDVARWYPTVTQTHRLNRTLQQHTMIVAGGTNTDGQVPFPVDPFALNDPRQTFESFVVRQSTSPLYLVTDFFFGENIFFGPARNTSLVPQEWLHEYPRLHLLGDGTVFFSGYSPVAATLDPETPPIVTDPLPRWSTTVGNSGTQWTRLRHDGSAVHFARVGPHQNLITRLGGSDGVSGPCTDTVEYCTAAQVAPPAGWVPLDPLSRPKTHANAIVLPDASILVIGGTDGAQPHSVPHLEWMRYTLQDGWRVAQGLPTPRGYHATAVLLPDGRVFVGGGEGRHHAGWGASLPRDYDIYEPPYLHSGRPRPTSVVLPFEPLVGPLGSQYHVLDTGTPDHTLHCDTLPGMDTLEKVVLIAPGSVTHHSDMSARYIELPSHSGTSREIWFDVPDEKLVPRGFYMLWAVTSGGTPSEATWVKVQ